MSKSKVEADAVERGKKVLGGKKVEVKGERNSIGKGQVIFNKRKEGK